MRFLPFDSMWARVAIAKDDSDDNYFNNLMYLGEMLVKFTAAGLVCAVNNDQDRHRYRQLYHMVHANSIGEWTQGIDEILTGVASQYLQPEAREEQRELTERHETGTWQYDSVALLNNCLRLVQPTTEALQAKVSGRIWFSKFAQLRNGTRGHGALPSAVLAKICPDLERSVTLVLDNFLLFHRPWCYLYQNLSGKYRITKWNAEAETLNPLKQRSDNYVNVPEGTYILYSSAAKFEPLKNKDNLYKVDLIFSDIDAMDFYFPNGNFNSSTFEVLSYITGNKKEADAKPYLAPVTALPPSETQGLSQLEARGESLVTVPPLQKGYIRREKLEKALYDELTQDNYHRIITLVGKGGIGKTWLALSVLNRIAHEEKYTGILWFSARDIDLLPQGAKQVSPHVLTEKDVAREFTRVIAPYVMDEEQASSKSFDSLEFFNKALGKSPIGNTLFVFDNFETVKSPGELFNWVDTYIRPPNKVLITTRFRAFTGDNPVQVQGMTTLECEELIDVTADALNITDLLTESYRQELLSESEGHPYVIKILLGEVAKANKLVAVERILATQENLLDTLFERTYSRLSPVAQRIFLTLSSWRSLVPELALEAVLLRPSNERMEVTRAVEELFESSLIEIVQIDLNTETFLAVPLVAMAFGQRKLAVSSMKSAIEADKEILEYFGAAQLADVKHGIAPRIKRLFQNVARKVNQDPSQLDTYLPILEFVAQNYAPAYFFLAELYEEENDWTNAKQTLLRFLQSDVDIDQKREAWRKLADLCLKTENFVEEIHARVELCRLPSTDFDTISSAASRLNALFSKMAFNLDTDEKRIIARTLVMIMEERLSEADATDCSRIAWLSFHMRDEERARRFTRLGLELDPRNEYCLKLSKHFV